MGEVKYCLCTGSISYVHCRKDSVCVQMEGDCISVIAALLNQPLRLRADELMRENDCHVLQSFLRGK